jgi:pimeloyl-ACP methyl ester carboxylesterase
MPRARVGDQQLEYVTSGRSSDPPLLLLMGTGASLVFWDEAFCERLANLGLFVIRFDARDTGRSTRTAQRVPAQISELLAELQAGRLAPGYTLETLAADAVGLLEAVVGDRPAHIVGISQGGALAQIIGLDAPARAATLTMIQGYSSDPATPPPDPKTMAALLGPLPHDRESMIARELQLYRLTGSRSRPPSESWLRQRAERVWAYGYDTSGFLKHLLAVVTAATRKPRLSGIRTPTLVVHGDEDPIIPLSEGQMLAAAIPGARLLTPAGMGHDLAPEFWDQVIEGIARLVSSAGACSA